MGVIVATNAAKSGSAITGDYVTTIAVKINPGYDAAPGHPGTGTLVATFCG